MEIKTLADLVFQVIPQYDKPDCLQYKKNGKYHNISGKEVCEIVESLAAKLLDLGVRKGDRIGLLSENRPEWAYADLAILCSGALTVPIYCTLPAKQIEYIVNDSGMQLLFVSSEAQLQKGLELRKVAPCLKQIILFDEIGFVPEGVTAFSHAVGEGKIYKERNPGRVKSVAAALQPDDVFTIVYTSGTTGEPKGVMLTHNNLISNMNSIKTFLNFNHRDRHLSFLPLCHIFERMAGHFSMLYCGSTIAYAESIDSVPQNLREVQPTVLLSVPRVYEKFYKRVIENVAAKPPLKKKIGMWALGVAAQIVQAENSGGKLRGPAQWKRKLADSFLFSKIKTTLGGRLRLLVSGGAALPVQLGEFFHGAGLDILEGYGLTETSPVIACNRPDSIRIGTVGQPIPGVEVMIAPDGEILTRGPHIMKGYYKKPDATAEVISTDGWFHTGDIGQLEDNFLRITDRKKDIIVTSAGKNIAPQFVENALKTSKYIAQIVVLGDKRKFPSALVVPNVDNLKKFASAKNIPEGEMFQNPVVVDEVQRNIDELSKDLAPFERVKKIALIAREFTVESGEMTPSLKIKRNVVEKKYRHIIDALYA